MSSSAKERMLRRVAADFESGMVVNLGIGLPSQVIPHVPLDVAVCLHAENGIAGVGPVAKKGSENRSLIDSGGAYVTSMPGTSFFDSAVSFAIVRSGRLDLTLLGAFQVAANGDLANWRVPGKLSPGPGGAIELAQKSRRVGVVTTHLDRAGNPKIVDRCSLPITALGHVNRIYTDLAIIDVTRDGLQLVELAQGTEIADVIAGTGAPLAIPPGRIPRF